LYGADGEARAALAAGDSGAIVLDRTPFYAERGGQAGDRGVIARNGAVFEVSDTQYRDKTYGDILHFGAVRSGTLGLGEAVDALVDPGWRREIRRHHTVTHLLQRALKDIVGETVAQRGSAVFPDRTRFDFDSPIGALSKDKRAQVAARVNELIRSDHHRAVQVMPLAQAIQSGAIYMKGEHYGDTVRVVRFGPSIELCGGTHVESTGEIGHFVLLSESAIGAGIRRVEGLVSESADAYVARMRAAIEETSAALAAKPEEVVHSAARLAQQRREFEKRIAALQQQLADSRSADLLSQASEVAGIPYLAAKAQDDGLGLRELAESIRSRFPRGVLALAGLRNGQVAIAVFAGADALERGVSAREILTVMAAHVDGKGGGNAAVAQGAGKNSAGLDAALASVPQTIAKLAHA
jgi:alanyl-tRNA synthetase